MAHGRPCRISIVLVPVVGSTRKWAHASGSIAYNPEDEELLVEPPLEEPPLEELLRQPLKVVHVLPAGQQPIGCAPSLSWFTKHTVFVGQNQGRVKLPIVALPHGTA